MEFGFFGSAVLWMLFTYPAYWLFQWTVEGQPFHLWRSPTAKPRPVVAQITPLVVSAEPSRPAVAAL